ncbi:MAG: ABC transporter substrate-binding protein [Defluviitaleaceae bacterium]|nr:ABC transporter substrate-binding protein [Defluviitaleaceae bacterium]
MKKFFMVMFLVSVLALVVACGGDDAPREGHINIAVLPGPSALGSLWLMDAAETDNTQNTYDIQVLGTPDEIVPLIIQGAIDIAAVPTNLASVLHNNPNVDITVLVVSTMGVLHVIDTTGEINNIADLAGRTVHLSGMGAAPELAFNYVLSQNNLTSNANIYLEFHAEQPHIAALLAAGEAEIALLPEPFATTVTMQNENARHALDLTQEWNRVQPDYGLVMTAIIVRTEFLEENSGVIATFLEEFEYSINFVNNNVAESAALAVQFGIIPNEAIAAAAIPRSNQVFITGERMRTYLSGYLRVLYEQSPASIGGAMPNDEFYFIP